MILGFQGHILGLKQQQYGVSYLHFYDVECRNGTQECQVHNVKQVNNIEITTITKTLSIIVLTSTE